MTKIVHFKKLDQVLSLSLTNSKIWIRIFEKKNQKKNTLLKFMLYFKVIATIYKISRGARIDRYFWCL